MNLEKKAKKADEFQELSKLVVLMNDYRNQFVNDLLIIGRMIVFMLAFWNSNFFDNHSQGHSRSRIAEKLTS